MPQLIASVEGVEVKHVYLSKDRTSLGRHPDNDIVLSNDAVSARHCVFELSGLADVFVEDLGSTNGTFVNNKRVKRQQLRDEDIVAISRFRIRYLSSSGESGFGAAETTAFGPSRSMPAAAHASFRVLNGTSEGLEVPVVKAVTTFGRPGVCVVSVSHRLTGYFVAHLDGATAPLLNGVRVSQDPALLLHGDELELGGTRMRFQLAP
jgi:pSer/pThr/pTyr-binding forkhead associated (FHA) protein